MNHALTARHFGVNFFECELTLLECAFMHPPVERILSPIGQAIRWAGEEANRAGNAAECVDDVGSDYYSGLVDEECDVIEALIGAAFVVCQPYITRVVSRVLSIQERAGDRVRIIQPGKKHEMKDAILRFGDDFIGDGTYTSLQVIDAYANYFKHHEEWFNVSPSTDGHMWKNILRTKDVLTSVGANLNSSGILRDGASAFKMAGYWETSRLADALLSWHGFVCLHCRAGLESAKLIMAR